MATEDTVHHLFTVVLISKLKSDISRATIQNLNIFSIVLIELRITLGKQTVLQRKTKMDLIMFVSSSETGRFILSRHQGEFS